MAHFPYGKPPQYFYPQWGSGMGQVRQSEFPAGHEVCSGCRQRKIRKLLSAPAAAVQTRLVEMEERCTLLTSELSKETKRANKENARAEQERARAEQERARRKEQTKRARDEAKRADREAGRAKAAETKADDQRKAADAWRKQAERARDKLANVRP
jgi:DNA invertase Pin-like site-specific DNA recombinase